MTKRKPTLTTPEQRRQFMQLSAQRTRHAIKADRQREIQQALSEWLHRWRTDPESILAEYRWTCPKCGEAVEPFVIEGLHGRPIVGRKDHCKCGYWDVKEANDE